MKIYVVGFLVGFLSACGGSREEKATETYHEFRQAMKSGDVEKLKKYVSARYAAEFLAPGQEQKMEMMKAVLPDTLEIKQSDVREKEAIIKSRGSKDGMTVEGITTLIKEGNAWKVYKESWSFQGPAPESASQLDPVQELAPQQTHSEGAFAATDVENQKPVAQLMDDLKNPNFYGKEPVLDSLLKRGSRDEAVRALNEMLRSKPNFPDDVKGLLKQAGAPVTFDWSTNSFEPEETKFNWREVEFEFKDRRIYSSGRVYLGRDVVEGFSRPQTNEPPIPMFARYILRVKGDSLAEPIEKVVDVEHRAGDHTWSNLEIATGLGKGEYKVDLLLHAQTVMPDGVPMSLTSGPVILALEGE